MLRFRAWRTLTLLLVIASALMMAWASAASAAPHVTSANTDVYGQVLAPYTPTPTATQPALRRVPPGLTGSATAQAVTIADFQFNPTPLAVNIGDTVTWTNNGPSTHTTASNTGVWSSGPLAPGAMFPQTFNTAGTFDYHCAIHSFMHGSIVVGGGATTNTPTATPTSTPGVTPTLTPVPPGSGASAITTLAAPQRLADTRSSGGAVTSSAARCFKVAGVSSIPADAGAVVLNVTSTGQTTNGWLTVYPDGQPLPATSTLNFGTAAYAIANGAIMRVGNNGQVCVSVGTLNSAPGSSHVILDATGFLAANALSQLAMLPAPVRLADTRTGGAPIPSGGSACFLIAGVAGVPADAAAIVLNVTGVGYSTNGWLTAYPMGQPVPSTSTVNFDQAEFAVANGALARVGASGQVCVSVGTINSAPGSSHVVLDVSGYLSGAAQQHLPMLASPQRVLDTRTSGGPIAAGTPRCFTLGGLAGVPANASGVVVNTTAVGYLTPGWLTVYPNGQAVPATSTLNFDTAAYALANGTIVALGSGGQVCVSISTLNSGPGSSHVILDVVGYLP